ncbi:predicted protein [Histoplasma mississippiense (nom. inval.)]|uniref:predicted protein n=1 Tax=Ajellomyces capsulatus (strain NAm1 / WU24) TaxID=2059318 RepID=UPI000157BAA1|nr:predicted protein [Histoplasma mississippiense (nom. inval.)]EDN05786.1 predicted protein [Histoplasma mississippiense (nom. inval.)]
MMPIYRPLQQKIGMQRYFYILWALLLTVQQGHMATSRWEFTIVSAFSHSRNNWTR